MRWMYACTARCMLLLLLSFAAHAFPHFTSPNIQPPLPFSGTCACSLDGTEPQQCTSPVELQGLQAGAHTLLVEKGASTQKLTFVVDTELPSTIVDALGSPDRKSTSLNCSH